MDILTNVVETAVFDFLDKHGFTVINMDIDSNITLKQPFNGAYMWHPYDLFKEIYGNDLI